MNRKLGYILVVLVLLFFTGCGIGSDGSKTSGLSIGKGDSTSSGSVSGKEGIKLGFTQGNPVTQMIKGGSYTFAFVFENYLNHEVTDLRIRTRGFDTNFVSGLNTDYSVNRIPKANDASGPGVYSGLVVNGVRVDNFKENFNFNPYFDYCYTAKTSFGEQICVPNKRYECDIEVNKFKFQSGVLGVSLGELKLSDGKIIVPIKIKDEGNGQVVNTCFNTEEYERNYKLESVKLGSEVGSCTPYSSEKFSLIQGESTIYCTFSRSQDEAYLSQLSVELSYAYQQAMYLEIEVEDLDKFN